MAISKRQLKRGAKVEQREHGLSWFLAVKIARDHLMENPRYYQRKR